MKIKKTTRKTKKTVKKVKKNAKKVLSKNPFLDKLFLKFKMESVSQWKNRRTSSRGMTEEL